MLTTILILELDRTRHRWQLGSLSEPKIGILDGWLSATHIISMESNRNMKFAYNMIMQLKTLCGVKRFNIFNVLLFHAFFSCFYYFPLIWYGYWKLAIQNTDLWQTLALKASPIATGVLYYLFLVLKWTAETHFCLPNMAAPPVSNV